MKELNVESKDVQRHYIELFDKRAYIEKNDFDRKVTFHFHVELEGCIKYANFIYDMETGVYEEAFAKGFTESEMIHLVQVREKIKSVSDEN